MKKYIYEKCVDLAEFNICRKKSHYARCLTLELLCNNLWSSSKKFGEPLSIWIGYTLTDASTRVSLLGTAGWTVCFLRTNLYCMRRSSQQGLQPAFDRFCVACDRAGTKISTMKIEALCLKTPVAMYSASRWQYTAAGGDVQVSWGGIHEWCELEKDWYRDW